MTYANNFYVSHIAEKQYPYINNKVEKLPKEEGKQILKMLSRFYLQVSKYTCWEYRQYIDFSIDRYGYSWFL